MRVLYGGKAGDIRYLTVTIDGTDLTQCVLNIEIFQDVFTPCWSAILTLNDTVNAMMEIPIRPASQVSIYIDTSTGSAAADGSKQYDFMVYRIGDKSFQNRNQQLYKLYCASKGFLLNQTKRIQKTYDNMKPEDAMSNIISEFLEGSVDSETSDNNYHIIIPNWSPFTTCQYLAKIAIKNNASDFIFFMKDTDYYYFKTIEYLYTSEDSGVSFSMSPAGLRDDAGDFLFDYSVKLTGYKFEHYDGLGNLSAGYYQNKLLSYDMMNKNFAEKQFKFGDDNQMDAAMKPWSDPILDSPENAHVGFQPKHEGLHEQATPQDDQDTWQTSRKCSVMKLEQDKFLLQLPGGAASWQWLGQKCNIDVPSNQDKSFGLPFDQQFQGDFLITAQRHIISQQYYTLNIEAVKKRHTMPMGMGGGYF